VHVVANVTTLRGMEVGGSRWAASGGVHRIPVSRSPGSLYLCGLDVVGPEPAAILEHLDASTLICLLTDVEIFTRYPDYLEWLNYPEPFEALRLPTEDHLVATDDSVASLVMAITDRLRDGDHVLVHCGAGWGRAGVIAVLVMVAAGALVDDAIRDLRAARPAAGPQSMEQDLQIERLSRQLVDLPD